MWSAFARSGVLISPLVSILRICSGSPSLLRTMLPLTELILNAVSFEGTSVFCSTASRISAPPCAVGSCLSIVTRIQSSLAGRTMGELRMNAGLLRVFGKNNALDLGAERRRDRFIFELVHADMGREEIAIEDDAELAIGRPILRGGAGQFAIGGPLPGAGHRRIEPDMWHRGIFQILEARR